MGLTSIPTSPATRASTPDSRRGFSLQTIVAHVNPTAPAVARYSIIDERAQTSENGVMTNATTAARALIGPGDMANEAEEQESSEQEARQPGHAHRHVLLDAGVHDDGRRRLEQRKLERDFERLAEHRQRRVHEVDATLVEHPRRKRGLGLAPGVLLQQRPIERGSDVGDEDREHADDQSGLDDERTSRAPAQPLAHPVCRHVVHGSSR